LQLHIPALPIFHTGNFLHHSEWLASIGITSARTSVTSGYQAPLMSSVAVLPLTSMLNDNAYLYNVCL
jgi:hypothetical protein